MTMIVIVIMANGQWGYFILLEVKYDKANPCRAVQYMEPHTPLLLKINVFHLFQVQKRMIVKDCYCRDVQFMEPHTAILSKVIFFHLFQVQKSMILKDCYLSSQNSNVCCYVEVANSYT